MLVEIDLDDSKNSSEWFKLVKALEEQITALLPIGAHVDGDDMTGDEATIYVYGKSADDIFNAT